MFGEIRQLYKIGSRILWEEGPAGIYGRLAGRSKVDGFDAIHGTETAGRVPSWRLKGHPADRRYATRYEGVDPAIFAIMMRELPVLASEFAFIDLGCGKGKALILALESGFREAIGVEIDSRLCEIAKINLARLKMEATVVCESATEYVFPSGKHVVFLYNPFRAEVLKRVLPRIPSGSYITYVNPVHANLMAWPSIYTSDGLMVCRKP